MQKPPQPTRANLPTAAPGLSNASRKPREQNASQNKGRPKSSTKAEALRTAAKKPDDAQVVAQVRQEKEDETARVARGDAEDNDADDVEVVEPLPSYADVFAALRTLEQAAGLEPDRRRAEELHGAIRNFRRSVRINESQQPTMQTKLEDFFKGMGKKRAADTS
jgi:hypothetical protein